MQIKLHEGIMKKSLTGLLMIFIMINSFGCAITQESYVPIVQDWDAYQTCADIQRSYSLARPQTIRARWSSDAAYEGVNWSTLFLWLFPTTWVIGLFAGTDIKGDDSLLIYKDTTTAMNAENSNLLKRRMWLRELLNEKGC